MGKSRDERRQRIIDGLYPPPTEAPQTELKYEEPPQRWRPPTWAVVTFGIIFGIEFGVYLIRHFLLP